MIIPAQSPANPISQPKPTVRFEMNPNAATFQPLGDTVSFQTTQPPLTKEQLQAHWDKLAKVIGISSKENQDKKIKALLRILPQIPLTQRLEFLSKTELRAITVLHAATLHNNPVLVRVLLAAIPDESQRTEFLTKANQDGVTALHCAALLEDPTMIRTLLEAIPDENQRIELLTKADSTGTTALHIAAHQGNPAVVKALLAAIPNETQRIEFLTKANQDGNTALHFAVRRGSVEVIPALLAAIPDEAQRIEFLAKANQDGNTSLHKAVGPYQQKVVQTLLEAIPNEAQRKEFLKKTNNNGKTALQNQGIGGIGKDTAGLMLAYGADPTTLTEQQHANILENTYERSFRNVGTLVNAQGEEAEASVRQAMQWLQYFPPNGGKLDWKAYDAVYRAKLEAESRDPNAEPGRLARVARQLQEYRTPSQKCDAFLQTKLDELAAAATKQDKKEILNRTWPVILGAGANCDLDLLVQLSKQAEQFGGKINDFTLDVLKLVGSKYATLITEPLDAWKTRQSATQNPK